ncbi:MAG: GatB/YqeY domain-containing protein [Deltaproteobacteria bacterium]|nr:GatB/YqeY domain-containing protein [Deltaproteobacteria bacterium]
MASNLEAQLGEELKNCMRSGDKVGTMAIRMVRTEVMKRRTAKAGVEVTDELVVEVIRAYVKQLQGSVEEYAARGVLPADDENLAQMVAEAQFLQKFLPQLMGEAETAAVIDQILASQGPVDAKMAGKITGLVMKDYKGRVDSALVNKLVRAKLGA